MPARRGRQLRRYKRKSRAYRNSMADLRATANEAEPSWRQEREPGKWTVFRTGQLSSTKSFKDRFLAARHGPLSDFELRFFVSFPAKPSANPCFTFSTGRRLMLEPAPDGFREFKQKLEALENCTWNSLWSSKRKHQFAWTLRNFFRSMRGNPPASDEEAKYTHVSAGGFFTALAVLPCGRNESGQCDLPALDEGSMYAQASAGAHHIIAFFSEATAHLRRPAKMLAGNATAPPFKKGMMRAEVIGGFSHWAPPKRWRGCRLWEQCQKKM